MGRGVSVPYNAVAVAYSDVSKVEDSTDWSLFIEWIQETAKDKWPSLVTCDSWLGREDHAILENAHCYIGVSEYCGLAAIWLKSKKDYHDNNNYGYVGQERMANLSDHWCVQVAPAFNKLFGEYRKVATFSNGESVYERV